MKQIKKKIILCEESLKKLGVFSLIKKRLEEDEKVIFKHLKVGHLKLRLNLCLGLQVKEQESLHESVRQTDDCPV